MILGTFLIKCFYFNIFDIKYCFCPFPFGYSMFCPSPSGISLTSDFLLFFLIHYNLTEHCFERLCNLN